MENLSRSLPFSRRRFAWLIACLLTLSASGGAIAAEVYEISAEQATLVSEFRAKNRTAPIIPPSLYKRGADGRYLVSAPAGQTLPDIVHLRFDAIWIEPVPDTLGAAKATAAGKFVVADFKGSVTVRPADGVATMPQRGMILPPDVRITTGEGSNLSLRLPDGESVRFGPKSAAHIWRKPVPGAIPRTQVSLDDGTVFSQIEHNATRKDFRVETGQAVAAARGTDYAVWLRNGRTVVCLARGIVGITAPVGGKQLGQLAQPKRGDVAFQAVPEMTDSERAAWLYKTLGLVDALNRQMKQIESKPPGQRTAEENEILASAHPISYVVPMRRVKG